MTDLIYQQFARNYLKELLSPYVQVEVDREVIVKIGETGDKNSPFKQFSKSLLSVMLSPYGTVEVDKELPPQQPKYIPVYCTPITGTIIPALGLIGKFLDKNALFHPLFLTAEPSDIRYCMSIILALFKELEVNEKGKDYSVDEDDLPCLWILLPTASESLLDGLVVNKYQKDFGKGVYPLAPIVRTQLVVIDQLPRTDETLWLRLITRGEVLLQAIDELEALRASNVFRFKALNALMSLRADLERERLVNSLDREDENLLVRLDVIYKQLIN